MTRFWARASGSLIEFTWSVSAKRHALKGSRRSSTAGRAAGAGARPPSLCGSPLVACAAKELFSCLPSPRWTSRGSRTSACPTPCRAPSPRVAITTPTPIQAATIPDALDGRDVCGKAPTGSGKTIAFGVPLVLRVERAKPRRPRGLVLAPTRELAAQISQELQLLAKPKGPWVEAFYGGVGFDRQFKALARGVDIAVACPGRLADLVQQKQVDLRDVDLVVIDEADRMADMGFLPEVKRILDACAPDRQTLLFSATLDGDVDVLIRRYQRDPARHEHVVDESNDDVTHLFWSVERPRRIATIAKLVADNGPTVVFCRTKRGADRVARQLGEAGVKAAAIHGDRSQSQRDRALRAFRSGDVAALVATDVAARGIHVDDVGCVVHYDLPADAKAYIHRSGRTGRAGALGLVVSVVPAELARDAAALQRELGYPKGLTSPDGGDVQPSRRETLRPGAKPVRPAAMHGHATFGAAIPTGSHAGSTRGPAGPPRSPTGRARRAAHPSCEHEGSAQRRSSPQGEARSGADNRDGGLVGRQHTARQFPPVPRASRLRPPTGTLKRRAARLSRWAVDHFGTTTPTAGYGSRSTPRWVTSSNRGCVIATDSRTRSPRSTRSSGSPRAAAPNGPTATSSAISSTSMPSGPCPWSPVEVVNRLPISATSIRRPPLWRWSTRGRP